MNSNILIPDYSPAPTAGAFDLTNHEAYACWRDAKLAAYPSRLEELAVEVANPNRLSRGEAERILGNCRRANMALVILPGLAEWERPTLSRLGRQLGLSDLDRNLCADEDGISAIQATEQRRANEYIPYTNQPLSWHTDGYYNPPRRQIHAWILFCARNAAEGGENALLDHEIAYILLRDEDPEMVRVLMAPDVMTVPANVEGGRQIRPASLGPVFSVTPRDRSLHMRYSARKRSIQWKEDAVTQAAVTFLAGLFSAPSPYILRHRLEPGQGLVSNNVLHNRGGFKDHPDPARRRLLYRARYFDRISDIGAEDINPN